jgi:hypothetical protein
MDASGRPFSAVCTTQSRTRCAAGAAPKGVFQSLALLLPVHGIPPADTIPFKMAGGIITAIAPDFGACGQKFLKKVPMNAIPVTVAALRAGVILHHGGPNDQSSDKPNDEDEEYDCDAKIDVKNIHEILNSYSR